MSRDELRVKPLSTNECLAVIWGLGRAVTVQNQEEATWKGQDRTRLLQHSDYERKVSRLEGVQGTG